MNNFEDQIKRAANSAQEKTPGYLWDKLERKLDRSHQKKQISFYRSLAIASSLIACVAIISLVYYNSNTWNPKLFAYTANENIHLEELPLETDDFYNTEHVAFLVKWRETTKQKGNSLNY